jgi:hypothetical protein
MLQEWQEVLPSSKPEQAYVSCFLISLADAWGVWGWLGVVTWLLSFFCLLSRIALLLYFGTLSVKKTCISVAEKRNRKVRHEVAR